VNVTPAGWPEGVTATEAAAKQLLPESEAVKVWLEPPAVTETLGGATEGV
jgi:hypothetical protein